MRKDHDDISENARRVQQNVSNLPLTSMALAGLLGAGVMALVSNFARRR